jgi:hypothetical protein
MKKRFEREQEGFSSTKDSCLVFPYTSCIGTKDCTSGIPNHKHCRRVTCSLCEESLQRDTILSRVEDHLPVHDLVSRREVLLELKQEKKSQKVAKSKENAQTKSEERTKESTFLIDSSFKRLDLSKKLVIERSIQAGASFVT